MDQMREKWQNILSSTEVCNFRELLLGQATKMQVIIAFLIILEMMKEGVITIVQEESFGEIHIAKTRQMKAAVRGDPVCHGRIGGSRKDCSGTGDEG